MSDLKEFSMNMPMIGIGGSVPSYDVTAAVEMPAEVCADKVDHIYVAVDSATVSNYSATDPMVCVDLVLTVGITNPIGGESMNYKMVKRLKLDKAKLAYEAESLTPIAVAEEEDPLEVARIMEAFYAATRAREIAGLTESAGTKAFKVMISFDDEKASKEHPDAKHRASAVVEIKAVRDAAHARHVFDVKYASKYPGVKITRVTEVA
jgi:hypothetical protein